MAEAETKLGARADNSATLRQELRQVEAALQKHKREAEKFSHAVQALQDDSEKKTANEVELQALRSERASADRMINSLEQEIRKLETDLGEKERELVTRLSAG